MLALLTNEQHLILTTARKLRFFKYGNTWISLLFSLFVFNTWCTEPKIQISSSWLDKINCRFPFIYHHCKVVVVKMLKFGHFGLKIGPLCFRNLTQNPWDYETRAQELTSGAIRMLLSFFVKIWELFKDGRVWGLFHQMNKVVNFDIFYNFWYISALDGPIWMKLVTKLKIFWCSYWIW